MNHLTLVLAAAQVPTYVDWSPKIAAVMILCNILAIIFGKATIKYPNVGPQIPVFGMSLAALLGTTSLGHIIGAGTILGLARLGVL